MARGWCRLRLRVWGSHELWSCPRGSTGPCSLPLATPILRLSWCMDGTKHCQAEPPGTEETPVIIHLHLPSTSTPLAPVQGGVCEAMHKRSLRILLRCRFPHHLAPSILCPQSFPEKFPIWIRACHHALVTGHRLCSTEKVAEDCCVFEQQPPPVQPRTVVLGCLTSAQEKGTPCPRMLGEERHGFAPVTPWTYCVCEWMKILCENCIWSSLKNTQPVARSVMKGNPRCSSKNSGEPWLGRAAFQPHPDHKAEKTSMGSSFWIIIIIIMTGFSSQDSDSL